MSSTKRTLSDIGSMTLKRLAIPSMSICVSCIGWQLGKVVLTDKKSFTNQQINSIIPCDDFDTLFLYYLLKTKRSLLFNLGSMGVRTPIVNKSTFSSIELKVPSLSVQRRISSVLSTYDDLIENNTRRIEILDEIARRLYEEWFVKFHFPGHEGTTFIETEKGQLPEGWEVSTIGQNFRTVLGGTPSRKKPEYWDTGDVPWIGSGKANELRILSPSEYITKEGLRRSATKMMPTGTTVLAITGATLGQVSMLLEPMCANQSVVGIIDEDGSAQEFLYRQVCYRIMEIINHASGGAQQHINKEVVKSAPYLVPSENILDAYNALAIPVGKQIGNLLKKNANLRAQRDLLLPKLISGQIDVSQAEEDAA